MFFFYIFKVVWLKKLWVVVIDFFLFFENKYILDFVKKIIMVCYVLILSGLC